MARKITRGKNGVSYYNGITGRKKAFSFFDIFTKTKLTSLNIKGNSRVSRTNSNNKDITSRSTSNVNFGNIGCAIIVILVGLLSIFLFGGFVKKCTSGSQNHHIKRPRYYVYINTTIIDVDAICCAEFFPLKILECKNSSCAFGNDKKTI